MRKKSIYKTEYGKKQIFDLYDRQLAELDIPYEDGLVKTSYGYTHVIKTGNHKGSPLMIFHGGNATTAYTLLSLKFLLKDFLIYGVDTIGHPGKSDEVSLSHKKYDYGKWASEVITGLGYDSIRCFGGSFGAGILAKTMCVAPEKISKAVLYVPAGIKNAPSYKLASMGMPMVMYWITGNENWLLKSILPMSLDIKHIDKNLYKTAKSSIDYAKIKTRMPNNVDQDLMRKCCAPTLLIASTKDCLFPAHKVIPQAKKMINDCTIHKITDRGHIHRLRSEEERMIIDFLKE